MLRHRGIADVSEIENLAIAICAPDAEQKHTGLIIKPHEGTLEIVHLAMNYRFERSTLEPKYGWTLLSAEIDPILQALLADWVDKLHRANGAKGLPFGFDIFDPLDFDENGAYIAAANGQGLTCASFVLVAFSKFSLELVDIDTWQIRPDDGHWQEEILKYYDAKAPMNAVQRAAQALNVGKVPRFRPEEVASSGAMYAGSGVTFATAEPAGRALVDEMKAVGLERFR